MNKKVPMLFLLVIIIYMLVVNINLPKELTFNGFEHNEEEILDEFEIVVNFKTGLTWNLEEEYVINSITYQNNTYNVNGWVVDLGDNKLNYVVMSDSPNYKLNYFHFVRNGEETRITGYRFKDGYFNSNGVPIY